jgi:predicted  nucleic acid-binding Zn-ribbon protein
METHPVSAEEAERLKKENDTLRRRIRTLVDEIERLRQKVTSTWGEA